MRHFHNNRFRSLLRGGASAAALSIAALAFQPVTMAQDQDAAEDETVEEVVVTGSRIRRDSFTSAAPMQTMDVEAARQIGVMSISELLQRSTIANGQQINGEINSNAGNSNASEPPPNGGVGSANIALRGLEAARTLILVNGRRLGSSGVRGAPAQPDINLLPINLIERVEVITEGASSVYGADAVAGVVNLLLRDDFEGMEVTFSTELPFDGGGEIFQTSFITGAKSDKASFVLSGEFFERKRLSVGDRRECVESHVIDAVTGELQPVFCSLGFFDNIIYSPGNTQPIDPATGDPQDSPWYYATPGSSDGEVPNFSSSLIFPEPSGPGQDCRRTDERCRALGPIPYYSGQNDRLQGDLVQPQTRFSTVALASYSPDWWGGDEEFYFEAYYMNRHAFVKGGIEQIFPTLVGEIPELDVDGNVIVDGTGAPILVDNPLNPFAAWAVPIITLDELRQDRDVQLEHFRFVGGFRGDFPSGFLSDNNWSYDLFVSYDRGTGVVQQPQLSEQSLILATQTLVQNADGSVSCGNDIFDAFGFITQQPCVPVDFFAASLYDGGAGTTGSFATDEERDFLVGSRVNNTIVEQFVTGLYFTGNVMELPAGSVGMAFGGEFRRDTINSFADFISAKSINAGENPLAEGATKGSRDIFDLYAEVNVPLLANSEMADYLGVEGAVHYTDEENFGNEVTTRARFTYRPVSWVQFSGSYGTSFRAPNLRETFLAEQFQGISSSADPCGVPGAANNSGVYDPGGENRSTTTLDNCILSGADPFALGLVANINIPVIISGNALTLNPETSRSYTASFQMSPPISDSFDVDIAISFFDIAITDSIRSVDAAVIMSRCYDGPAGLTSPFCDRVTRTLTGNPNFDFVTEVDASFVNVGRETSQGFDVNTRFSTTVDGIFEGPLNVAWAGAITFQTERKERIFNEDPFNDLLGDFGTPKRRFSSTVSLGYERFEFLWDMRHQSGGQSDQDTRITNDCDAPNDYTGRVGPNSLLPLCSAPGAWYHDIALTYRMDSVVFTVGMNNVLDKTPPLVNIAAGSNRANRVTSSGYEQFGRSVFFTATAAF